MEKIKSQFEKLDKLKVQTTAENYLKETSLADLQTKITEIDGAAKQITDTWDKTNWEDLPDADTTGYESKRQEALDLRDEIKAPIQDRITELEKLEVKSELAGAVAQETTLATTIESQLVELTGIHKQLREDYATIIDVYLKTTPRSVLEPKLKTIETLRDSYLQKFQQIAKDQTSKLPLFRRSEQKPADGQTS